MKDNLISNVLNCNIPSTLACSGCTVYRGHWSHCRWQGYGRDLGLPAAHVGRSCWVCSAWLSVHTWVGYLIECTGAMVTCLFGSFVFDFEVLPAVNIHKGIIVNAGVTMTFVLSDIFPQPLLACARTFGCKGVLQEVSMLDHILVYWVGPTLGSILSLYLAPFVKRMLLKFLLVSPKKLTIAEDTVPLIINAETHHHKM